MKNLENRNAQRVGIVAAASLAALATGAMGLSSLHEFRRLEVARGTAVEPAIPGTQGSRNQITIEIEESLKKTALGGVLFVSSSVIALGAAASVIQSGRKRPGFENTDLVEPQ